MMMIFIMLLMMIMMIMMMMRRRKRRMRMLDDDAINDAAAAYDDHDDNPFFHHGSLSEAEEDDALCKHLWTRMWLSSPKADAHKRLQVGHGTPVVRAGRAGCCSVSSVACRCKALATVVLKVRRCLPDQGAPVGPVVSSTLALPRLEVCPLDVGLEVVFVRLSWATLVAAVVYYQLSVEQLPGDSCFVHADGKAGPSKLGLGVLASILVEPVVSRTSWLVIRSRQRIRMINRRERDMSCSSCFMCLRSGVHVSQPCRSQGRTTALYTLSWVVRRMSLSCKTLTREPAKCLASLLRSPCQGIHRLRWCCPGISSCPYSSVVCRRW